MHRHLLSIIFLFSSSVIYSQIFVDSSATTGANNGSTWTNAYVSLQDALSVATAGDSIYVSQGTYYPDEGSGYTDNSRDYSFIIPDSVIVLGGFCTSCGDITLASRDWKNHHTILSGEIQQDGVDLNNSFHVVTFGGVMDAELDGFTIAHGEASGSDTPQKRGGGIFINGGLRVTLRHLTIRDNYSIDTGGGLHIANGSSVSIENSGFVNNLNEGLIGGGGIYVFNSELMVVNTVFKGNRSISESGGGIFGGSSTIHLTNVTASGNAAEGEGSFGYFFDNSNVFINNTIIWNNLRTDQNTTAGSLFFTSVNTATISHSIVQHSGGSNNWMLTDVTDGGGNKDADPLFVQGTSPATAPNDMGDLRLRVLSPAINMGDNSLYPLTAPETDLAGADRIQLSEIDMGAFEATEFCPESPVLLYVDSAATGANTGLTWMDAFTSLQDALNFDCSYDSIFVSKGTYYPDEGAGYTDNATNSSFIIPDSVTVLGGFNTATGDTTLASRDWKTNLSILSGDIDQNGTPSNNSNNVIRASGKNGIAIDGFVISGGYAQQANNQDKDGGGLLINNSSLRLVNSIVTSNRSFATGGGMRISNNSFVVIENVVFSSNRAQGLLGNIGGAAIIVINSDLKVVNTAFLGNWATNPSASVLFASASNVTFTNTTASGNSGRGTGHTIEIEVSSTLTLNNCIIWNNINNDDNSKSDAILIRNNSTATISNSIIQSSGGSNNWMVNNANDGGSNKDVDPQFVQEASPTTLPNKIGNLRLKSISPAINMGDNSLYTAAGGPPVDLDNVERIQIGQIDMGAYEFNCLDVNNVLYVDSSATGANTGLSWRDAFTSLQDALIYPCGYDSIFVSKGTYYPDESDGGASNNNDKAASFIIPRNRSVFGGFNTTTGDTTLRDRDWKNNPTILSGDIDQDGNFSGNSYHVVSTIIGQTVLDGFTITWGNANGGPLIEQRGAGVFCRVGTPTLQNLTVIHNQSEDIGAGMFFSNNAAPLIYNSIIADNEADAGGGVAAQNADMLFVNTVFQGNFATAEGGALLVSVNSDADLINCSFSGNRSDSDGGAVYQDGGMVSVANSIIWNNSVNGSTSGTTASIYVNSGTASVTSSIIDNSGGSGSWVGGSTFPADGGNNKDEDPLFVTDVDPNIAPTDTGNLDIQLTSPAIDMGNNSLYPVDAPIIDLDCNQRIRGIVIDMGAYEALSCVGISTLYVDSAAAPGGDGLSWQEAFTDLQDALQFPCDYDSILVSKGTYFPDRGTGDTDSSFVIPNGIVVLGGFSTQSGDTTLATRDWKTNQTIWSGDLDRNGTPANNSTHVISATNAGANTLIDGMIVEHGNAGSAAGGNSLRRGGGLIGNNCDIHIRNTVFRLNRAAFVPSSGGAVFVNSNSDPVFENCLFYSNQSRLGGGAIGLGINCTLRTINTVFRGNYCTQNAGGSVIYGVAGSAVQLINTTISGNRGPGTGSAIDLETGSSLTIENSIIWNNNNPPSVVVNDPVTYVVRNSIIEGSGGSSNWMLTGATDGGGNKDTDPVFVTAAVAATTPNNTGDLRLQVSSPAINMGNSSLYPLTAPETDLAGADRIQLSEIDMGAYEAAEYCPPSAILYVDSAATGANTGLTWMDAFTTLQDALNYDCGYDSIYVSKGTYYPDEGMGYTDNARDSSFVIPDSVVVLGGFNTATGDTTLSTRDWKVNTTILSGDIDQTPDSLNNSYHVIVSTNTSPATLVDGIIVEKGNANGAGTNQNDAGGIWLANSDMRIANLVIRNNNSLNEGGGLWVDGGNGLITNTQFIGNTIVASTPSGPGANVSRGGSAEFVDVDFIGNRGIGGSGAGGGLDFNGGDSGRLVLRRVNFIENSLLGSAVNGGGFYAFRGEVYMENVTFSGNFVDSDGGSSASGGGIYLTGVNSAVLVNVLLKGNSAVGMPNGLGGGMYLNGDTDPILTNVTFSGNAASGQGGAIYNRSGSDPLLQNVIIWNNSANGSTTTDTASIYNYSNATPSVPVISNSIVQHSNGSGINWNTDLGVDGGKNKDQDPLFFMPVDPSGAPDTAGDYRLTNFSPAIDMGDSIFYVDSFPVVDLADGDRIQQDQIDMGAYESALVCTYSNIVYVDSAATGANTGLNWINAFTSLQDALNYPCDFDTIYVSKGTYYPDENYGGATNTDDRSASFLLGDSVVLLGGFNTATGDTTLSKRDWKVNTTILSGDIDQTVDNGGNSYHVVTTDSTAQGTLIDGVTITAGNADNSTMMSDYSGGGMYITGGQVRVANSIFTGNTAGFGGGMATISEELLVTNTSFTNNQALEDGGAVYQAGIEHEYFFVNVEFKGNAAGRGGAFYNKNGISGLLNTTFSGNKADSGGGALDNESDGIIMSNTIIWNNVSGDSTASIAASIANNGFIGISYSIIANSGGSSNWLMPGNVQDLGGNKDADPEFKVDASPAGAPNTFGDLKPAPTSPAIDMGDSSQYANTFPKIDLACDDRIQGDQIDMGSYEANCQNDPLICHDVSVPLNEEGMAILTPEQLTVPVEFDTVLDFTGSIQSLIIPAGVQNIYLEAAGGSGGNSIGLAGHVKAGGKGAIVGSTFDVTPGDTLQIIVAAPGGKSNSGAGGGGATFVARGHTGFSDFLPENILAIAGGGGGASVQREGNDATGLQVTAAGNGGGGSVIGGGGASATADGGGSRGGQAAVNGAGGGGNGGFGGGGGGNLNGGGGAGASGGSGSGQRAGAGSSSVGGESPFFIPAISEGSGYVRIRYNYAPADINIQPTTLQCSDIGNTVEVLLVQTNCDGSQDSCIAQVTPVDIIVPEVIAPRDTVVACDQDTDPQFTGMATTNGLDGCGIDSIVYVDRLLDHPCMDTILRIWTAMDAAGNESRKDTQIIALIDTVPPVISCVNDTLTCGTSSRRTDILQGSGGTVADGGEQIFILPGIDETDRFITSIALALEINTIDLGAISAVLISPTGSVVQIFSLPFVSCAANDIVATFSDTASLTNAQFKIQCNASDPAIGPGNFQPEEPFSIFTNQVPFGHWQLVITNDGDDEIELNSWQLILSTESGVTFSDACNNATLTYHDDSTGLVNDGVILRTFVATDGCGNQDSCVQMITVVDTNSLVCRDISVPLDTAGIAILSLEQLVEPQNVDTVFAFTGKLQSLTIPAGVTRVYIEAAGGQGGGNNRPTDDSRFRPGGRGGVVGGQFAILAGETLQIIVGGVGARSPEALDVAGGGGGGASFVAKGSTGFSDFLPANMLLIAGGGGGAGTLPGISSQILQLTAEGDGGSGDRGGASATEDGGGNLGGQAAINGASGGGNNGDFGFGGGGGTLYKYNGGGGGGGATGGASQFRLGSAGTSFTEGDYPVFQPDANDSSGYVHVIYNYDINAAVTLQPDTITCSALTTPQEVLVIQNRCDGTRDTCIAMVTAVDLIPPVVFAPADAVAYCNIGTDPEFTGSATADGIDSCGVDQITFTDKKINNACTDTIFRIWTATDFGGNISEPDTQIIAVLDTVPPVIICPVNDTIQCGGSSMQSITVQGTDAGGVASGGERTFVLSVGDEIEDVLTRVELSVEIEAPNVNELYGYLKSPSGNIEGVFDTDASFECGDSNIVATFSDTATAVYTDFTDECSGNPAKGPGFYQPVSSFLNFAGENTNGDWSFEIANDSPDSLTLLSWSITFITESLPIVTDACSAADYVYRDDTICTSGNCNALIRRTWIATDGCGNQDSCVQMIAVVDTVLDTVGLEPVSCPTDTIVSFGSGTDMSTLGSPEYAMIACCDDLPTITFRDVRTGFDGTNTNDTIGIITRTFIATDCFGNIDSTCVQMITVIDAMVPVIICPSDTTIDCSVSTDTINTGTATAIDVCGLDTIRYEDTVVEGACANENTTFRLWIAVDNCGHIDSCTQVITRIDTVAPVIVCPPDMTISCAASTDTMFTGMATATDPCGIDSLYFIDSLPGGDCSIGDTLFRTFIAIDNCGHADSCVQVITRPVSSCSGFAYVMNFEGDSVSVIDIASQMVITNIQVGDGPVAVGFTIDGDTALVTNILDNSISVIETTGHTVVNTITGSFNNPIGIVRDPFSNTFYVSNSSKDTIHIVTPSDGIIGAIGVTDAQRALEISPDGTTLFAPLFNDEVSVVDVFSGMETTTIPVGAFSYFIDLTPDGTKLYVSNSSANTVSVINTATNMVVTTIAVGNSPVGVKVSPDGSRVFVLNGVDANISIIDAATDMVIDAFDVDYSGSIVPTGIDLIGCDLYIPNTDKDSVTIYNLESMTTTAIPVGNSPTSFGCFIYGECEEDGCFPADMTGPVVICPSDTTIDCSASTDTMFTGMATATDPCGIDTLRFEDTVVEGACVNEDTTFRLWIAADNCGNMDSCTQVITRIDTIPPLLICPPDVFQACSIPEFVPTLYDTLVTRSPDKGIGPDGGTITRDTITLLDVMGTTVRNVYLSVDISHRFSDQVLATLTSPSGTTLEVFKDIFGPQCNERDIEAAFYDAALKTSVEYDNQCNVSGPARSGNFKPVDPFANFAGESIGGDWILTITDVADGGAGRLNSWTLGVGDGLIVHDDCSDAKVEFMDDTIRSTLCPTIDEIVRTWVATDACGHRDSCVQHINIFTPLPEISCPPDTTIDCASDMGIDSLGMGSAEGGCIGVSTNISFSDTVFTGSLAAYGYAVGGRSGADTLVRFDLLTGDTMMLAVVPTRGQIQSLTGGEYLNGQYYLSLKNKMVTINTMTGDTMRVMDLGNIERFYAMDIDPISDMLYGIAKSDDTIILYRIDLNTKSITKVGEMEDIAQPVWLAVDPVGNAYVLDALTDAIYRIDLSTGQIIASGIPVHKGNNPIDMNWSSDAEFVTTTEGTFIYGLFRTGMFNTAEFGRINPQTGEFTTRRDIGGFYGAFASPGLIPVDTCPVVQTIVRTFIAEDDCGQQNLCTQTIELVDTTAPVFVNLADTLVVACKDDTIGLVAGLVINECHLDTLYYNEESATSGGCMDSILRIYTAIDQCGNSKSKIQIIIIRDTIPPQPVSCPPVTYINCEAEDSLPINMPDYTDNCSPSDSIVVTTEIDSVGFGTATTDDDTIFIHYFAEDQCGNVDSSCTQVVLCRFECPTLNCHGIVNVGLGSGCSVEITPDMILNQPLIPAFEPYCEITVEDEFGRILPDNILSGSEALGHSFTVTIRCEIPGCGTQECQTTVIVDEKSPLVFISAWQSGGNSIINTRRKVITGPNISEGKINVYCGNIPDPSGHLPMVTDPCSGKTYTPEVQPDWVMPVPCDEVNDTAEVILRTWETYDKKGDLYTLTDTIVVFRLPKLTPGAFIGTAEDSFYCDLVPVPHNGEVLKRYASWKQPVGLHDYELPYTKLRGVTYEIPSTIIAAGLINAYAQGIDVFREYLDCVILRKADGTEWTIGDIVLPKGTEIKDNGDIELPAGIVFSTYIQHIIDNTTSTQKGYGFLQLLIELNENPAKVTIETFVLRFFPYLLLQEGDWILSEGGNFEQVDASWFYNGNGNSPYWFAGGWPSIYDSGDCIRYCDVGEKAPGAPRGSCVRISVPELNIEDGFDPSNCDTICLPTGVHCGITVKQDAIADWTQTSTAGSCPKTRGMDSWITQTCWARTPNSLVCDPTVPTSCEAWALPITLENFKTFHLVSGIVESYECSDKSVKIHLSQWQTLYDTLGPIFDFCYPADWDQEEIQDNIRSGKAYLDTEGWERDYPMTYRVGTHDCEAEVYVPSVRVIDNCSGVHQVKAMVDVPGGTRAVALERTATETIVLPGTGPSGANGDTCYIYTYSHTTDPIRVPFSGCAGELTKVRYEAADNCWNQSEWYKYIRIIDDVPPTVVVDREVTVPLQNKIAWVHAETFDEGSWDNCSIDLRLARRTDWWADTACVDLCDSAGTHAPYDNWIDLLDDLGVDRNQAIAAVVGGTVGESAFNSKYNVDDLATVLNEGEVEEYYFDQIVWLWTDAKLCAKKVVHGWLYAIAAYIAENCSAVDEHGNVLDVKDLEGVFDNLTGRPGYGKEIAYLGGGWSKSVPFKCEDACEEVTVELAVFDNCCNWGKGWSTAHVEDKGQARLVKRLPDLDITCEAYNSFYKDIVENAAALGANGSENDDSEAYADLDSVFGHYVKTWVDNQNRPTDIDGNLLGDSSLNFDYNDISCSEKSATEKIAVKGHDGTIEWVNRVTKTTYLDTTNLTGMNGIIGINCAASCIQDVWMDLDECGQGTITRRFTITGGCGPDAPTWEVEQVINVASACGLRESMFDLPQNVGTKVAPVCLPEALSDSYFPNTLGAVTLKPGLEQALCNSIAIGKEVKKLDVLGNAGMKKYVITWSVIDWCVDHTSSARQLSHTQEVIATIDPDCTVPQDTSEAMSQISGHVMTELNSAVNDVEVKAVLGKGSPIKVVTPESGEFSLKINNGSQVSIIPHKNTGFSNGISTADLIDIQRHVLQKKALDTKYQRIAADVNGNGRIDGLDVLELRKLVLNPSRVFANNTSWRFFETTTDKEVYQIDPVTEDQTVNFTAVKIGDVNLSGDPARSSRSTDGQLHLNIADKILKGGEMYRVEVRSDNFKDIRGLQYTMSYASPYVSIESIEPGVLNVTPDNYLKYAPGVLTLSWNESEGVHAGPGQVLFTIVVKALNGVKLRDILSLNNQVTPTEAYSDNGDLKTIALRFDGFKPGFALYQNTPNPYTGETVIGFKLPQATSATMTIYDVTGKMIKRIEGEYEAGYNEVRVRSEELGTTGVLYYQLDTDKFTAAKKMIIIN